MSISFAFGSSFSSVSKLEPRFTATVLPDKSSGPVIVSSFPAFTTTCAPSKT